MAVQSPKQTIVPNNIMDNDTDLKYLRSDQGNYVDLLNARNTKNGAQNFEAVVDDDGNILIPNTLLPSGRNKCVASYEDIKGGSIIYFIWNELGYNSIFRYFLNASSGNPDGYIELIWQVRYPAYYNNFNSPNPLDFDESISFSNNINVIDDLLTFSNKKGDPVCLNMKRANETDKQFEFEFYVKKQLPTNSTTIDFALYRDGQFIPVISFSITTTQTTYNNVIADIYDQLQYLNISGFITVQNKGDYLLFKCVDIGRHYLYVSSVQGDYVRVLPGNFYPDFIQNTPYSYPPLPAYMFYRIKYPPFQAPVAQYIATEGVDEVIEIGVNSIIQNIPWIPRFTGYFINSGGPQLIFISPPLPNQMPVYQTFVLLPGFAEPFATIIASPPSLTDLSLQYFFGSWTVPTLNTYPFDISADNNVAVQSQAFFIGFNTENNDVNNWVTLGVNQPPYPKNLFLAGSSPAGFISVNQITNLFFEVDFKISFGIAFDESAQYSPGVTPTQVQVWLVQNDPVTGSNQLVYKLFDRSTSAVQVPIQQKFMYTADPNYRYQFAVVIENIQIFQTGNNQNITQIRFDDGIVYVNKAPFDLSNIWRQTYQFRAAYRFLDQEISVLGETSKIPLPEDTLVDSIAINFDDKWLNDPSYSALIKEVYCYLSNDGIQWFMFQKKSRKDFVITSDRTYNYKESDQLLAVAPNVYLQPYHAVPRSAQSEALIDNRLFNGGILEGFDAPLCNVKLSTIYKDITNTSAYNNRNFLSNKAFRYGSVQYVGLVYYDDADRKCGVSLVSTDPYKIPELFERTGMSNTIFQAIVPGIRFEIFHEPPVYATKYRPVVTSDISITKYLVFFPTAVNKVNIDLVVDYNSPRYWEIDFDSITYYVDKGVIGSKIDWTWGENDRIRIIASAGGLVFPELYDLKILKVVGTKIYVTYDASLPFYNLPNSGKGLPHWIQIYSVSLNLESTDLSFHEVGETYEIKSALVNGMIKRFHDSPIQPQTYGPSPANVVYPAIIDLFEGGTYYRLRSPFSYYSGSVYIEGTEALIYDSSPNDYLLGDQPGWGRDNFILPIGEVYRYSAFKFSDRYISGTATNELNVVQGPNDLQYDLMYGVLFAMVVFKNDILRLFFSNGYSASVYVNQAIIRQTQAAENLIAISDDVAANSHILERTWSGINPESIVLNDEGDLFGYDDNEGVVYRQSGNGTNAVSDIKQKSRFNDLSVRRRFLDRKKSFCPAVYDLYHDEYIITINGANPQGEIFPAADIAMLEASTWNSISLRLDPGNQFLYSINNFGFSMLSAIYSLLQAAGCEMSYNFDRSIHAVAPSSAWANKTLSIEVTWQVDLESIPKTKIYTFQFGDYTPAVDLPATSPITLSFHKEKPGWTHRFSFTPEMYGRYKNEFVSFVNGELWLHNRGQSKNYYGVQYPMELEVVCNDRFPSNKRIKGISINAQGRYGVPKIFAIPYEGCPTGMQSMLEVNNFAVLEGNQYAAVLRDMLTPGALSALQGLINGRPIIGQVITFRLQNNSNNKNALQSIDILYFSSENN